MHCVFRQGKCEMLLFYALRICTFPRCCIECEDSLKESVTLMHFGGYVYGSSCSVSTWLYETK